MSDFRREPIRSRIYLDGARDSRCTFQIPGVCTGGPTVSCHIRDETHGRGIKADDISTADGCQACHDRIDGRSGILSQNDWLFYALRALQRTLRRRHAQGLLRIDDDKPMARKAPKRKPKGNSRPIPHPEKTVWPTRELRSRNMRTT
jgi:hypothetical protein